MRHASPLAYGTILSLALAAALLPVHAQGRGEPGKSIGSVTVRGNLIVMTLDEGVLGKESLFDLAHRTVRYTPDGAAYRVESARVKWDSDFGPELTGSQATLKSFAFP